MCGIAGIIDPNTENKEIVAKEMVSQIFHRGPDQDGFFVDENVALGMRRLSIIDLSTGKQPIWSQDSKKCIFFNGEIYNYKELKKELEGKGRKFSTNSDTEVILQMFEEFGEKMLPRLRGMFAFCIYNIEQKNIFIARDFFGIKPLYYLKEFSDSFILNSHAPVAEQSSLQGGRVIAFASEIKSFIPFPGFKAEVNDSAVYNYLQFQYNPLEETFFKSVYKLPPAHYMQVDVVSGKTEIKKYWSFEIKPMSGETLDTKEENEMSKKIFDTVKDSVEYHMIADVPVGSFLSGGVDSSIIATMMQKIRGDKKIKTFTVGFNTLTEGVEASQTSDFLGTDHTEIKIGPEEYFSVLPKAVWHFDEPVADPSAIGLYFVAREARKHVTVVLSGEGADELFGGYNIYLAPFAYRKIAWVPKSILSLFLKLPFGFWGKNYIYRAYEKMENWYIGNASIFKDNEMNKIWLNHRESMIARPEQSSGLGKGSTQEKFSLKPFYEKIQNISDSAKMQYIDVNTWLVGDILAKADKMTMANSLELRVPFLDIEVSNLAVTIPDYLKWKNGKTKYLLRKAFSGIIPEGTRNRKKLGFPTPVRDWFTTERNDQYEKIYNCQYIKDNMNMDYIKTLIDDHTSKKADNSRKIYLLLMLALWYDVFINNK